MVPYCDRKWYHIDWEYGTILMKKMVPYSFSKWYHILLVNGTIFFSNISLFQNQKGYNSISILSFFNFNISLFRFEDEKRALGAGNKGLILFFSIPQL